MMRITYQDGRTEDVRLTMLDQMKAEEHAQQEQWGGIDASGVRRGLYAVYWHLRSTGGTSTPFERWAGSVVRMQDMPEEPGNPTTGGSREASAN